jgi:phytoene synthase
LLDGVTMDIEPRGCADEAELRTYCWRVASAVGLACLPVLGATGPAAQQFAESLGRALQFTNILRDLRTDAEVGRIYVPRTWLAELRVAPEWLLGRGPAVAYAVGGAVEALCQMLAAAARDEFALADAALRQLPRRERRALVPARIMGAVYRDLLRRLEQRGGDLILPRTRVPKVRKLWLALLVFAGVQP